jgi:hypothetical protein
MELVHSMNSGGINAEVDYGTMAGGKTQRGCLAHQQLYPLQLES